MSEALLQAAEARIASLLEPIQGGVGEDVSYDEKFGQIKAETEKIASLSGAMPDWGVIASLSTEILQEKSKDFRVACYLATFMMRQSKLEPLLDGLLLVDRLSRTLWDTMFPQRVRARAGMVGWMSDQAGPVVIEIKLKAADGPIVAVVDKLSSELDQYLREKFGDAYPGMSQLREGVRHLVRTCPREAPPPPPPPPKPEPGPQAASAPAAPAAAPAPPAMVVAAPAVPSADGLTGMQDVERVLQPTSLLLTRMGAAARRERPDSDLGYRLSRFGTWLTVLGQPALMDGNKTMVPPPPPHIKGRLEALAGSQDWLTLLHEADGAGGDFILWLDPQRFVSTAMSALGPMFAKAKNEVLLGVALLLRRVPSLAKLAYMDGTPFADPQTQMWIDNEVAAVLAQGGADKGGGRPSVLDEPLKEARELAMKGELPKACEVLARAACGAPSPAERFRGRLAVAELCLQAGQFAIARGQLEGLTEDIKRHDLAGWDPELCAQVYAGLYAAHKGANTGQVVAPEAKAAERAAFEALCQLDPAAALKLGAGP
jgi:type VI secretion system protein VasJ